RDLGATPLVMDYATNASDLGVLELIFARQDMAYPVVAPPGVPADRVQLLRRAVCPGVTPPEKPSDPRRPTPQTHTGKDADIAARGERLYASPREVIARARQAMEDGKKITVSK